MPSRAERLKREANRLRREQAAHLAQQQVAEPEPSLPEDPPPTIQEDVIAMPETAEKTFWTRFTVPGASCFTYRGQNYDRGQLITLTGGPRDEQLERLGYVQVAPKEESHLRAECGVCSRWFLTEQFRDAHGRLRHSDRFAPEDLEIGGGMDGPDGGAGLRDVTGDAEERRMQQQYPLYLERTRATLESA